MTHPNILTLFHATLVKNLVANALYGSASERGFLLFPPPPAELPPDPPELDPDPGPAPPSSHFLMLKAMNASSCLGTASDRWDRVR